MDSESIKDNLVVKFSDCDVGWIRLTISSDSDELEVRLSHWLDPLPAMLAWLEAVAVGVNECSFTVDEEGSYVVFCARRYYKYDRAYTTLTITPSYDVPPLKITLPTFELVGTIYRSFCEFSKSDTYLPEQWECFTLNRKLAEKLGLSAEDWIDSVIGMNSRELRKAIWLLDPSILTNPEPDDESVGTEAELLELTGESRAEAGGLPSYWFVSEAMWGESFEGHEQARRIFLEECLIAQVDSYWDGTPWKKMRSQLIEKWLQSEVIPAYYYWGKWLEA